MEENVTAEKNIVNEIAEIDKNNVEKENIENLAEELDEKQQKKQTSEQNKEFARIRRNKEREIYEKGLTEKTKSETQNEILEKIFTSSGKKFNSIDELEEFFKNQEDLKRQKVLPESVENVESTNNKEGYDWYIKDKEDFFARNKDFDDKKFEELINDEDFCEYSRGKVGKTPLNEIYSDYLLLLKKSEKLAQQKAERMYLKKNSSPGSLSKIPHIETSSIWGNMNEQEFEKAISNAKKGLYSNKK